MHTEPAAGRLFELSPSECWELVASRPVGRLAWNTTRGPTIVPVNFSVDGESVVVRTSAYTAAAREAEDSRVTFQVDSFDRDARTGWSVLLRGLAHRETVDSAGSSVDPQSWVSGPRSLVLRVEVDEITGRAVRAIS